MEQGGYIWRKQVLKIRDKLGSNSESIVENTINTLIQTDPNYIVRETNKTRSVFVFSKLLALVTMFLNHADNGQDTNNLVIDRFAGLISSVMDAEEIRRRNATTDTGKLDENGNPVLRSVPVAGQFNLDRQNSDILAVFVFRLAGKTKTAQKSLMSRCGKWGS